MEDNENDLLKWGFLIVTVLAVLWAIWRVMEYKPAAQPVSPVVYTGNLLDEDEEYTPEEALQAMKLREFLEEKKEPTSTTPQEINPAHKTPSSSPQIPEQTASNATKNPISAPTLSGTSPITSAAKNASNGRAIPVSSHAALVGNSTNQPTTRPVGYGRTQEEAITQQRNRMLAPYLIPNKDAQKNMNDMVATLAANITRTVNRALKPRSKKEENIEKYLGRSPAGKTAAASTASDPFEEVANQVSAQKENVVSRVSQAFGSRAGSRAGALMDSFAQEMSDAMSNPELTPTQKAERAQKISNKYQKKLDKMTQENQFNQFANERLEKDNKQKADLASAYPDNPDFNQAAAQIIDKARERDLALAQHPEMAEGDYYRTLIANQYKDQHDLEEAAKKYGASTAPLHKWQNDQEQDLIKQLGAQEEEGKINSYKSTYTQDQIKKHKEEFENENNRILTQFEKGFGAENKSQAEALLNEYNNKMIESMQKPQSPQERAKDEANIRNEYNRKFLQFQMDIIKDSNLPPDQKEAALKQMEAELEAIPEPQPRAIGEGI